VGVGAFTRQVLIVEDLNELDEVVVLRLLLCFLNVFDNLLSLDASSEKEWELCLH
jgi:hypothetical protein